MSRTEADTEALEVREALRALVHETLATGTSSFGYTLGPISFGKVVEVMLEKGGTVFVMWLAPIEDDSPCFRKTARLKVGHRPDAPDPSGYAVIDAICARLKTWEASLPNGATAHLFGPGMRLHVDTMACELLAVRTGVKPACRVTVDPESAGRLVADARGSGLHVVATDARDFVAGFCWRLDRARATVILHIARSEAAAILAAEAERAMIETCREGSRATEAQVHALGAALGYPSCCIDAFMRVRDRPNPEIKFYALQRTPGAGLHLLNNLLEERALISHCPCRYDCSPSFDYAQALFRELARAHPALAAELERGLRGLFVSFCGEGALRLNIDASASSDTYRYTALEASGAGSHLAQWHEALRAGDRLTVRGRDVRIWRDTQEIARLEAPPSTVDIRRFD